MVIHPLQFFKDLVDNPQRILQLENQFYAQNDFYHGDQKFSMAWEENREEGYYIIDNPTDDGPEQFKVLIISTGNAHDDETMPFFRHKKQIMSIWSTYS